QFHALAPVGGGGQESYRPNRVTCEACHTRAPARRMRQIMLIIGKTGHFAGSAWRRASGVLLQFHDPDNPQASAAFSPNSQDNQRLSWTGPLMVLRPSGPVRMFKGPKAEFLH
ncbi:MAG TPA: hypothetical protein V6D47_04300, partial [Oscillatoriaceae cyanobacterium]